MILIVLGGTMSLFHSFGCVTGMRSHQVPSHFNVVNFTLGSSCFPSRNHATHSGVMTRENLFPFFLRDYHVTFMLWHFCAEEKSVACFLLIMFIACGCSFLNEFVLTFNLSDLVFSLLPDFAVNICPQVFN